MNLYRIVYHVFYMLKRRRSHPQGRYFIKLYDAFEVRKGIEEILVKLYHLTQNNECLNNLCIPKLIAYRKYDNNYVVAVWRNIDAPYLIYYIMEILRGRQKPFIIFVLGRSLKAFHNTRITNRPHVLITRRIPNSLTRMLAEISITSKELYRCRVLNRSLYNNIIQILDRFRALYLKASKIRSHWLFDDVNAHLELHPSHILVKLVKNETSPKFYLIDLDGMSIAPAYFDLVLFTSSTISSILLLPWFLIKGYRYVVLIERILLNGYTNFNVDYDTLLLFNLCATYYSVRVMYDLCCASDFLSRIINRFRIKITLFSLLVFSNIIKSLLNLPKN